MSEPKTPPAAPGLVPETPAENRQALERDRQLFHLKTLYEASQELSSPASPIDLLQWFLPMAMGPLGLTFGFAVLLRPGGVHVACLGQEEEVRKHYERSGAGLVRKFFPEAGKSPADCRPTVLVGQHLSNDPNLPTGTTVAVAISIAEDSHVVLGFGPKISKTPLEEDETELLHSLAAALAVALRKASADEQVHALNADLREKNERMEQAQNTLSRHAFQLQTLYETTLELSGSNNPLTILDTFVLTLMGTFSYASGWISLHGPETLAADVVYRGPDPDAQALLASTLGREAVLARFVELKDRMPQDQQAVLLQEPAALAALPVSAEVAVLFSVDGDWRGAIGLGTPLADTPLTEEMTQLLLSLTGTFLVTMANAKHFNLIQDLNSDLAQRNAQLQATLDDLTSAKQEIGLLTEAKERIIGLVHGEVARVWRASWLDAGLIVLAGIVLGSLFNLSSPSGIALVPPGMFEPATATVEAPAAFQETRQGEVVIIDARPVEFFNQAHIPNAVNLPKDLFNFVYAMKLSSVDPEARLIVYGRTISRHYDEDVARELRQLGHENIVVLAGGLSAWEEAGYEVEQ